MAGNSILYFWYIPIKIFASSCSFTPMSFIFMSREIVWPKGIRILFWMSTKFLSESKIIKDIFDLKQYYWKLNCLAKSELTNEDFSSNSRFTAHHLLFYSPRKFFFMGLTDILHYFCEHSLWVYIKINKPCNYKATKDIIKLSIEVHEVKDRHKRPNNILK